eukprot:TRINITY_DN5156_c0_g1_i4.p1 TRINITY_DN5156_c0_g1~~TRINITY_DN5156_c0_g1_i4.p1  ORF type:complete len:299 (+),score=17.94 TRINITY_DN5156_c0_g1_i4:311-1207(+)
MIVWDYMVGGTIFDRLSKYKKYTEAQTAKIARQMAELLNKLHSQGIIHRDIKLENIFHCDNEDLTQVKLGGFDHSCLSTNIEYDLEYGTAGYLPPEHFYTEYGGYSHKSDIFSFGIVLYTMLSGSFPYKSCRTKEELYMKNKYFEFDFKKSFEKKVSTECYDLISKMLELNPRDRLSSSEILNHSWICKHSAELGSVSFDPVLIIQTTNPQLPRTVIHSNDLNSPERKTNDTNSPIKIDSLSPVRNYEGGSALKLRSFSQLLGRKMEDTSKTTVKEGGRSTLVIDTSCRDLDLSLIHI